MSVYHVFANRSNVGDWLSARGIQSLLGLEVTELLCDEPFIPETLARLSTASPNDFIVIGGGGLFMDYFESFWRGFRALAERVPFVIWGAGCCHMKRADSALPAALLEPIVLQSRLCCVRDDLTRDHLARCHLPPPVPCPTVAVVAPQPPGRGVLHVDALDNVGDGVYEEMNRLGTEFAARTDRSFRAINNLIPKGSEQALVSTLGFYERADLVLAGRLHGCIIGLAMGRKVLAVSGDHKVESFMEAAGLGDWVLGLDEIDALPRRLEELSEQPSPVEFLERARRENRRIADEVRALISVVPQRLDGVHQGSPSCGIPAE